MFDLIIHLLREKEMMFLWKWKWESGGTCENVRWYGVQEMICATIAIQSEPQGDKDLDILCTLSRKEGDDLLPIEWGFRRSG